jgi:hypothetical protein
MPCHQSGHADRARKPSSPCRGVSEAPRSPSPGNESRSVRKRIRSGGPRGDKRGRSFMDGFIVVPHKARYWTLEARIGTSITVTARGPGHHYPWRGDTVDHRTARHVELLVALYDNELGVTVVATAIASTASTALFLGSILAHEIARARSETSRIERSRCHAVRVWRGNRITSDIKRPCDEFALTIVGPWARASSSVSASALGRLGRHRRGSEPSPRSTGSSAG